MVTRKIDLPVVHARIREQTQRVVGFTVCAQCSHTVPRTATDRLRIGTAVADGTVSELDERITLVAPIVGPAHDVGGQTETSGRTGFTLHWVHVYRIVVPGEVGPLHVVLAY